MWDEPERDEPPIDPPDPDDVSRLDLPLRSGSVPPRRQKVKPPSLFPEWERHPREARVRNRRRDDDEAPETDSTGSEPPELGARIVAAVVDLGAVAMIGAIVGLGLRLGWGWWSSSPRGWIWIGAFVLELALAAGTLAIFLLGRTPGMALAGVEVVEPGDQPVRFSRAASRCILALGLSVLGLLPALFRDDGRTVADLVSRTELRRA